MKLEAGLSQRLSQTMRITPRMLQSIEILQLPIAKLEEYINQELVSNPTLEVHEDSAENHAEASDMREQALVSDEKTSFDHVDEISKDEQWNDYFDTGRSPARQSDDEFSKMDAMENTSLSETSLRDYLSEQLMYIDMAALTREIIEFFIQNINDSGYMNETFAVLRENFSQPVDDPEWDLAITTLQSLDPPGIGTENLQNCLLLQLNRHGGDNRIEEMLIREHFDDIAANRIPQVAKKSGLPQSEVVAAVEAIATLKPRPGIFFAGSGDNSVVIPDVIVRQTEDDYTIQLREESLPELRVSDYYSDLLPVVKGKKNDYQYLKGKIDSAKTLITAIEQRRETIRQISAYIVHQQRAFLEEGVEALKPMKMQDVADAIGRHLATVGRAISDKYIQTPQGIYPFKYFFSAGLSTTKSDDSGEAISESNKAIMNKIKQLIESEDKARPLSDQGIADILKKSEINIARRTVAKYREAMGILSTRQRKVYK